MRLYQPLQRAGDSRWVMGCQYEEALTFPIGYCSGWHEEYAEVLDRVGLRDQMEALRPLRAKFHEHGHASMLEAAICYRDFLLDTSLKLYADTARGEANCMICQVPTEIAAKVLPRFGYFPLCHKHMTRAWVEKLMLPSVYVMVG